jgi:hypothetical protein
VAHETTPVPSALERVLGETEPVRRALYPVVVCVVALLVAYGLLDAERVPLWLALAVAVLGIGGTEAARAVAYAPATYTGDAETWRAALTEERARREALETELLERDEPGAHAADRARGDVDATGVIPAQEAPTGLMRAPSRAMRCREVDEGRRCLLTRDHEGPHKMPTG